MEKRLTEAQITLALRQADAAHPVARDVAFRGRRARRSHVTSRGGATPPRR